MCETEIRNPHCYLGEMGYYYGDLSGNSSSSSSSSSSEEERRESSQDDSLWSRCILHLDIDCFYCQAEELHRRLPPSRPLAIGQKHIIVTCNYAARKYGVGKLQLREKAMALCPSLLIVEGSDLKNYKQQSRFVYEAFRKVAKKISPNISCKKGTMDEMMADLSPAVDRSIKGNLSSLKRGETNWSLFVFGESKTRTKLVEDQTGQETVVSYRNMSQKLPPSRRNVHEDYGTERDKQLCIRRLEIASSFVERICEYIQRETGFYCTGGISVSPLLAKVASDINKPKSINILYPWKSSPILYSMPLRKLQNVGSRTMRALKAGMEEYEANFSSSSPSNIKSDTVKTVLDLLRVPHTLIAKSLESLQTGHGSNTEQCDLLLQRCRGLDTTDIIDDEGLLPKTVSIENSFKRGSICSMDLVWRAMDDLLQRLPLLLNDRTSWATNPHLAFPNTIRMTVRVVDRNVRHKRRPFVTKSKQKPIPMGRALVKETNPVKQSLIIKRLVQPLLEELLSSSNELNVTRLNIAMTNFQDILSHRPNVPGQASLFGTVSQKKSGGVISPGSKTQSISTTFSSNFARKPTPPSSQQSRHGTNVGKKQPNKLQTTRIDSFFRQKSRK